MFDRGLFWRRGIVVVVSLLHTALCVALGMETRDGCFLKNTPVQSEAGVDWHHDEKRWKQVCCIPRLQIGCKFTI